MGVYRPNTPKAIGAYWEKKVERNPITRPETQHGLNLHGAGYSRAVWRISILGCEIGHWTGLGPSWLMQQDTEEINLHPGWNNDKQSAVLTGHSVGFPVSCQAIVEIIVFSEPQFHGVEGDRARKVDPAPQITAAAALTAPPLAAAAHCLRCRREVLHQQAGVNGDEDRRCEIAEEAENLACCVGVIYGGFLGEGTGAGFADGGDDAC
jgi:hypothetical protein